MDASRGGVLEAKRGQTPIPAGVDTADVRVLRAAGNSFAPALRKVMTRGERSG